MAKQLDPHPQAQKNRPPRVHGDARTPTAISIRAFARAVGVDHKAVMKGMKNGRLERCLRDGRIIDVGLAKEEWRANQRVTKVRGRELPDPEDPTVPHGPGEKGGKGGRKNTTAQEHRLLMREQRRKLRLANDETAGRLINARQAEIREAARILTARNRLLGIPSRVKQRLPHLSTADLLVIDEEIRQALDELAPGGPPPPPPVLTPATVEVGA